VSVKIIIGDALTELRKLPSDSVDCCVTSPPYLGLRDYEHEDQIGLESSVAEYVAAVVEVLDEARRVLSQTGTLWLVVDDSYATDAKGERGQDKSTLSDGGKWQTAAHPPKLGRSNWRAEGFKRKDLFGIPWRLALALQDRGWWLRCDIIWAKDSCMPERVSDRPTRSHEYIFLLSKSGRYFYDAEAIAEPTSASTKLRLAQNLAGQTGSNRVPGKTNGPMRAVGSPETRNCRSVWRINPGGFEGGHFATYPPDLAERCILAGCPVGGTVLDPFGGAGTTGLVADRLQRNAILIELNPDYAAMARRRIDSDRGALLDAMEAA
jgi:DNA modification methylase